MRSTLVTEVHEKRGQFGHMQQREPCEDRQSQAGVTGHWQRNAWGHQKLEGASKHPPFGGSMALTTLILASGLQNREIIHCCSKPPSWGALYVGSTGLIHLLSPWAPELLTCCQASQEQPPAHHPWDQALGPDVSGSPSPNFQVNKGFEVRAWA